MRAANKRIEELPARSGSLRKDILVLAITNDRHPLVGTFTHHEFEDGPEWIWNIADQHFPGAIQIIDLYHARPHLWDLARKLYPNDEIRQKRWMMRQQARPDAGKVEKLVALVVSATVARLVTA